MDINSRMHWVWIITVITALLVGIIAGYFIRNSFSTSRPHKNSTLQKEPEKITSWTCSMHPQIRQPKPGKCPICFMDLIPVKQDFLGSQNENIPVLKLSPRAEKMAGVQTEPVRRKVVKVEVRLLGIVDFDESLIAYITARMPGRIDKLYVDYTGISVQKGDHMAEYFSPELMVAQKELLLAMKDYRKNKENKSNIYADADKNLKSVLKKFEIWGLTKENIDKIIKSGEVANHLTLYAPVSGIVIHKNATEGKYFETGDRLFTIANLSKVWIMLEAYETDIPWLRYGQEVTFTTESCPGEVFKGRISFIDPVLNPQTRTVKVRVDASNLAGKLKPEMFVNAVVYSKVSQTGKVIDPHLAGKWICPMHPSVIKDSAGNCDICGMKLVKAESLGYSPADEKGSIPLVIPASAPLITGKRAVVYLASKDKPGTYYGQEVVLGPRAGNYYIVDKGLKEGDLVVVNGNFKIDSALQILARPSMMSEKKKNTQKNETVVKVKDTNVALSFKDELDGLYSAYFDIQKALAADKLKDAKEASKKLNGFISKVSHAKLNHETMKKWHKLKSSIQTEADEISNAKNITKARETFSALSTDIYELCRKFGTSGKFPVYRFFCPMAFDNKGGYWLQDKVEVSNPYFGSVMLRCGEKTEDIAK
jgi:Cu(I)/Ag(I) efflux system membrane fusion protein